MKIVVLDGYAVNPGDNAWDEVANLGEFTVYDRTPTALVLERARDADVLLVNKVPLSAETLAQLPRLRFVSVLATGFNMIDVTAARRRGVAVANVPEYGTDSVAQHVFALLLELCHHVGLHHVAVTDGEWSKAPDFCFWKTPPIELAGLTMGIVGFGRIGRRVAEIARAFGMSVMVTARPDGMPAAADTVTWHDISTLVSTADVVSLHCPLTETNFGFVDAELLARMRPTAFLINTARGQLIDEHALAEALNRGQLGGAGLDVVAVEPMRPDNPLRGARNCIITPHMAWASLAARRRLMATTAANVKAFLAGRPIHVVN